MELNEYQEKAMETCMESSNNFSYMALNLIGEVGEFMSKIAKLIRKEDLVIANNKLYSFEGFISSKKSKIELKKEAGDIMWQIAGLCKVMDWELEDVCQMNLDKLKNRQERNVIDGEGDNR